MSCANVTARGEFSDQVRNSGLALFLVGTVFLVGTTVWWLARKKAYYLRKRSLGLVSLSAFGGWLQLLLTGLGTFLGRNKLPCDLYLWTAFLIIPLSAGPIVVRLLLFNNTVQYNKMLLEESEVGFHSEWFKRLTPRDSVKLLFRLVFCHCRYKASEHQTAAEEHDLEQKGILKIGWKRESRGIALHLFTTKVYGYTVLSGFVILSIIAIVAKYGQTDTAYGHGCSGCRLSAIDTVIFSLIVLFIVLVGLRTLFILRDAPDPMGIVRELQLIFFTAPLVVLGMILSFVDPGNLSADGTVQWLYLSSVGILVIHFIQCPLQVMRTYQRRRPHVDAETVTLEQVLDSPSAREAFVQYLSTEFSLENFYFYEAVANFKARFDTMPSDQRRIEAEEIASKFLKEDSLLEVNISFKCKRRTYAVAFGPDEPSKTMFDEAQAQVKDLMRGDSFERFTKSTLFKDWSKDKSAKTISIHQL